MDDLYKKIGIRNILGMKEICKNTRKAIKMCQKKEICDPL
jgi:hypothetical protein